MPLSRKQKAFCDYYLQHWVAAEAARQAGYSKRTARAIGSRLLTDVNVKNYIAKAQEDIEKAAGISRLRVVLEHKKMAFSNIASIHTNWMDKKEWDKLSDEEKACIQEIETHVQRVNEGSEKEPKMVEYEKVKVKFYNKQSSLDAITKMLGYNEPEKNESTVKVTAEMRDMLKPFKEKKMNDGSVHRDE